jgi:hypothetical protein
MKRVKAYPDTRLAMMREAGRAPRTFHHLGVVVSAGRGFCNANGSSRRRWKDMTAPIDLISFDIFPPRTEPSTVSFDKNTHSTTK